MTSPRPNTVAHGHRPLNQHFDHAPALTEESPMTIHDPTRHTPDLTKAPATGGAHKGGHSWMMYAMCAPMLVLAIALVATGVVGIGFVFVAIACTAMMAFMMRGMGGGGQH
ncbi:hypothetical protein OHT57_16870 [Streptomyces sp. NBC_00285]|uniref:hypothetical protein n=1 Tax=Streptomyces sp. NBC_00285 TaxID=2975700 RepID=UPI002E2817E5|nr:hypothetical protein [Streptomyces sp. NBC_00285]